MCRNIAFLGFLTHTCDTYGLMKVHMLQAHMLLLPSGSIMYTNPLLGLINHTSKNSLQRDLFEWAYATCDEIK